MNTSRLIQRLAAILALAVAACATAQGPRQGSELKEIRELNEPTLYDFMLGEIALQRGDTRLAAQTFVDLAKRTRDPRVARRAVEISSQGQQPDLAIEGAKIWQELEPNSPQALQVLAVLLVNAKRADEAEAHLRRLITSEGASLENGFMQLGRLMSGNPDKAQNLRVVRRLAAPYPQLPQARLAVAQAAMAANDDPAALAELRQAQSLRPEWELPVLAEAQILQKRSSADAAKRLGEFVEKNPGSRDARLNYARALWADKRPAEAREQLNLLLAANPNNPDVIYSAGLMAFQQKDYAVAEQNMRRLLTMRQRDPEGVRFLLGQIAEEQKKWPEAIRWYEQVRDGDQAFSARLRTASALAKQGKVDAARDYLQKVAADNPEQEVQLVVAEAQLLRDANRAGDAFTLLGEALNREPDQPELLYDYALTAEKLEKFDLLEANLRKLIKVRPDYAHAYNALGYSFADRNLRLPEARKLIEKALELSPEDFFIMDSLGWVQYREGDLKAAAATLRRAYGGRPDAEIGAHLGEVLWMLGQRDEANSIWQESLKTAPENETLQKTIKRLRK